MATERIAEECDERGVIALKIVGDAENHHGFSREFVGEILANSVGVFSLHAENPVGPAEMPGGDFDAGVFLRASGARLVVRMVF